MVFRVTARTASRLSLATLGYLFLGIAGIALAIPPGYSSPIFPAAGLAFVLVLTWGPHFLPAIWLGSFSLNIWIAIQTSSLSLSTISLAAMLGLGASLQAWLAAYLVKNIVKINWQELTSVREVLYLLFFAGPLACLISATWGNYSLFMFGVIPIEKLLVNWVNWWLGDTTGVISFSLLILAIIFFRQPAWKQRTIQVAIPTLIAISASILLFFYMSDRETKQIKYQLSKTADDILHDIQAELFRYEEIVATIVNLKQTYPDLSYQQFETFTGHIFESHPELQAVSWNAYVTNEQREQFEATLRDYVDNIGLTITERDSDGTLISAAVREWYVPVTFIAPFEKNQKAIAFDIASNPNRMEAIERAISSKQTAMTSPIRLVQESGSSAGVLLMKPLMSSSAKTIEGFAVAVIRMENLMRTVLTKYVVHGLNISVTDVENDGADKLLFSSFTGDISPDANFTWNKQINLAGRSWELTILPSAAFVKEFSNYLAWQTLLVTLWLITLLEVLLLSITGRHYLDAQRIEKQKQELADSNFRWQFATEGIGDGLWDWNLTSNVIFYSKSWKSLLGYWQHEIPNEIATRMKYIHPDDKKSVELAFQAYLDGNADIYETEYRMQCKNGRYKWFLDRAVNVSTSPTGSSVRMIGKLSDITQRKEAEEKIKLSSRVFDEAHEGIIITDAAGVILNVNPTFTEITGYSAEDVIGKNSKILQSGQHSLEFYRNLWNTLQKDGYWHGEIWNKKKDGERYAELLTISSLKDEQGAFTHFVGLFSDITEYKLQEQSLQLMAHYCPLTGLPNRILLSDRFEQAISLCQRQKTLLAVCFMDLDKFKPVNDTYGHEVGDKLLVDVAKRIQATLRQNDTVSRLGGDEFALLIGGFDSVDELNTILQRLITEVARPYFIENYELDITASLGVTLYPEDNQNLDTLLRHADQAMYQAKLSGKNQFTFFDSKNDNAQLVNS